MADLELHVRIVITLPQWRHERSAPLDERERWERIASAIREHEHAHRDLTIEAAETLHAELSALEARGCRSLRRAFSGAMAATQERVNTAHAALDRATPERLIGL